MPVLDLRCECGHVYEALKSFTTVDPGVTACPKCGGSKLETLPSGFILRGDIKDKDLSSMDPLEAEMHMANRRHIEANSDKVLSGEMSIKEQGPACFRPQLPDHLKKKYF